MHLKRIISNSFIIITLISCTKQERQRELSAIEKEQLTLTIDKFNQAFREGDTDALASMITDNYVHTNGSSSSFGKDAWLTYLRKREADIKAGNLEITDYQLEDLAIEYHVNLAIVTGKVQVASKRNDELKKNSYRITNVWVYESGNWKRAGFHDGKIM